MKRNLKIGTRVIGIGSFQGRKIDKISGTVLDNNAHGTFLVEFDKPMGGHGGGGGYKTGEHGHCWWVDYKQIMPITSNIR